MLQFKLFIGFFLASIIGFTQSSMTNTSSAGLTFFIGDVTVHCDADFTNSATGTMEFKGTDSPQLEVNGDCTINSGSTFTKGIGTIVMNGGGSAQLLDGGGKDVYNLTIDNSGSTVTLSTNSIGVDNVLTFTNGHLVLSTLNITINSGGSISGEGDDKFAVAASTGEFIHTNIGTTKTGYVKFPVGFSTAATDYSPIEIDNATDATYGVRLDDAVLEDGTSGAEITTHTVDRTWHISHTAGAANGTLRATWDPAIENSLFLRNNIYFSGYTGAAWNQVAGSGTATASGGDFQWTMPAATTTLGKPFAIAMDNVLPVELIDYTATKNQQIVDLEWSTASETDCDYYTIEKSSDNETFSFLLSEEGNGNTTSVTDYIVYDENPFIGDNYYRLTQYDYNGSFEDLGTRHVYFENFGNTTISLFPNPTNQNTFLNINALQSNQFTVLLLDELGRKVKVYEYTVFEGENIFEMNTNGLAAGQYYIQILGQNEFVNIQNLTITK